MALAPSHWNIDLAREPDDSVGGPVDTRWISGEHEVPTAPDGLPVRDGLAVRDKLEPRDDLAPQQLPPARRSIRLTVLGVLAAFLVALAVAVGWGVIEEWQASVKDSSATGLDQNSAQFPVATAPPGGSAQPKRSAPGATSEVIYVHILGQVLAPGLYSIDAGARLVDAAAAAGGLTDQADTTAINLARVVNDGEQIYVLAIGEDPASVPAAIRGSAAGSAKNGSGAAGQPDLAPGAMVNLNTANQADLETLPRVGPALAGRIIDWREASGPFISVDDLLNVSGIGSKTLDGFRDQVSTQ